MQYQQINTITATTHVKQTSKGGRIWLEGDKLKAAGFVAGSQYSVDVVHGNTVLLTLGGIPGHKLKRVSSCSGGDRPIIDLHNKAVLDWFPAGTELTVVFNLTTNTIEINRG